MICPYCLGRVEQINQNRYEYDDEGRTDFYEHKMIETRHIMECQKENCAAWHDGRCHYSNS